KILVCANFSSTSKSLSPVIRCVACPSIASDNRKLSLGSLQAVTLLVTFINLARLAILSNKYSISSAAKYFLNLLLRATSKNSSTNSSLKKSMTFLSAIILSSFEKSFVSRKAIQRLVSMMTLFFSFGIPCSSYKFHFFCDFGQGRRIAFCSRPEFFHECHKAIVPRLADGDKF